jgi:SSS family transporter
MSLLDLAVVVIFLGGIVVFAGWLARRQQSTADFFLGGGRMGAWPLGLSLAANQVSAVSLVGAPAFVALQAGGGLRWLQYEMAVPLAMAALILWGVPLLRRAGGAEVYAAVEGRLGPGARRALAAMFLIGRGLGVGVILLASGRVVAACAGWSLDLAVLVVAAVAMAYTGLGGLIADVVSDVVQLALLWGAVVVAMVVLGAPGGLSFEGVEAARLVPLDIRHHGLGDGVDYALWPMLLGGFFLYLSYYGCDQTQAQRILAARSGDDARRALAVGAAVRFPLVLTYCLFGVMLAALFATDRGFAGTLAGRPPDDLVPMFLIHFLPHGLLGVVVAGILAAALSSVDSAFNSLSAVTVEELVPARVDEPRQRLAAARWATVGWGGVATVAALVFARSGETVIELINQVGSALYGPIVAVFVLAWRSRRADGRSAVLGAVAGVLGNLALAIWAPAVSWLWWNLSGAAVTLLVGVLLGRASAPVEELDAREGRGLAVVLVCYFTLIVLLLLGVSLAVA